jgi:hypothetical protein
MPFGPFGFVIAIIMVVFGFVAFTVKLNNDYKLRREELQSGREGSSLGSGELRRLIREAVADAIVPVEERLELIERQMRQLPESRPAPPRQPGPGDEPTTGPLP